MVGSPSLSRSAASPIRIANRAPRSISLPTRRSPIGRSCSARPRGESSSPAPPLNVSGLSPQRREPPVRKLEEGNDTRVLWISLCHKALFRRPPPFFAPPILLPLPQSCPMITLAAEG